jgi:hypothetical protein
MASEFGAVSIRKGDAMPTEQAAFYIELSVEADKEHVYVSSKDVPGLHVMGRSLQSAKALIESCIKKLFLLNSRQSVNLVWLSPAAQFPSVAEDLKHLAIYKMAA